MLISCIIPTGDRPTYLKQAVECFFAQTWQEKELIILDDGATPTPRVDHPQIRYLYLPRSTPRISTGTKRNTGNCFANGELIAHFDDDDWSAPGRLEHEVRLMERTQMPVVGYHDCDFYCEADGNAYRYMFRGILPYAVGTTLLYRKDYWKTHQFQDRAVGEDTMFVFRANAERQIASVPNQGRVCARNIRENTAKADFTVQEFTKIPFMELPAGFRAILQY